MSEHANASPGPVTHPPPVRCPNAGTIFQDRARRFRQLAQRSSSISGYLNLLGDLAEAQHEFVQDALVCQSPEASSGGADASHSFWQDDPAWRETARRLAERLNSSHGPEAPWLAEFRLASNDWLADWAGRLLAGDLDQLDAAKAVLVAGALQVHRTTAASRFDVGQRDFGELDSNCPLCGFLPASSLIQATGAAQGLRYLVCGLCATEWNRPRIHCVHCGSSKEVAYFGVEGTGAAVKAEACAACKSYVKLLNREKDTGLDAFADDVATLSLDLLMAEQGYQRLGFNPLLIPGQ